MLQISVCFTVFRFTAYGSSLGDNPEIAAQTVKLQHQEREVWSQRAVPLVKSCEKTCNESVAAVRKLALPGIPRETRPTELQKNCDTEAWGLASPGARQRRCETATWTSR